MYYTASGSSHTTKSSDGVQGRQSCRLPEWADRLHMAQAVKPVLCRLSRRRFKSKMPAQLLAIEPANLRAEPASLRSCLVPARLLRPKNEGARPFAELLYPAAQP